MQRRLVAVLAADVVGYSRLMGEDEEGTLAAPQGASARRSCDPRSPSIAAASSRRTGDGLLVEFASVVDAVRCAVEIQRGMAERNADVPDDRRIEFRIGINVGDIIIDGRRHLRRRRQRRRAAGRHRRARRHLRFSACVRDRCADKVDARLRRSRRAAAEEHRTAGARLSRCSSMRERAIGRRRAAAVARQAVDRGAAVPEHERRSGAGILRRRHGRGHHHRAVAAQVACS